MEMAEINRIENLLKGVIANAEYIKNVVRSKNAKRSEIEDCIEEIKLLSNNL